MRRRSRKEIPMDVLYHFSFDCTKELDEQNGIQELLAAGLGISYFHLIVLIGSENP